MVVGLREGLFWVVLVKVLMCSSSNAARKRPERNLLMVGTHDWVRQSNKYGRVKLNKQVRRSLDMKRCPKESGQSAFE
jgi:hypothetical protein